MTIGITTGPGRNWANIWKPLIDAFGPVLGENPERPFHPNEFWHGTGINGWVKARW